jgi:hypothetical protein
MAMFMPNAPLVVEKCPQLAFLQAVLQILIEEELEEANKVVCEKPPGISVV